MALRSKAIEPTQALRAPNAKMATEKKRHPLTALVDPLLECDNKKTILPITLVKHTSYVTLSIYLMILLVCHTSILHHSNNLPLLIPDPLAIILTLPHIVLTNTQTPQALLSLYQTAKCSIQLILPTLLSLPRSHHHLPWHTFILHYSIPLFPSDNFAMTTK